jgi:hypothetical protein
MAMDLHTQKHSHNVIRMHMELSMQGVLMQTLLTAGLQPATYAVVLVVVRTLNPACNLA